MPDLKIETLDARRLADAYPLIRSATRVSQHRWEAYARALIAAGGGVLAVVAPDGCIHGAAAFRPALDLRHERSLDVQVLVAFELHGDNRVREQLCGALNGVAAALQCRTVNVTAAAKSCDKPSSACRMAMEQLGLTLETVNFVRDLVPSDVDDQTRK